MIICRIDSNNHDTARPEHESAGAFREVFLGRLVRRGWMNYPFMLPNSQLVPVRARQRASSNQNVRRQKATVLWQHKHGSRNITSYGKSNLGKYCLLVTSSPLDDDAPHDTGLARKVDL